MNQVKINKKAQKQIKKIPDHIVRKLQKWIIDVGIFGIEEIKVVPGYHDEGYRHKAGQFKPVGESLSIHKPKNREPSKSLIIRGVPAYGGSP